MIITFTAGVDQQAHSLAADTSADMWFPLKLTRIVHMTLLCKCLMADTKTNYIWSTGDIIIGGLFPVHEEGSDDKPCGSLNKERGIQRLEAMRFAVQHVNENTALLKGVQLGMKILDTCSGATHALDQSIDFVMTTLAASQAQECPSVAEVGVTNKTRNSQQRLPIVAVIGAAYSKVSIQIANLLRLFKIPQISYASTSSQLSKKENYGYFMRTVPPDKLQAKALVDIVTLFNWTYVSTVASYGDYGVDGIDSFKRQYITKKGRCISVELKLSSNPDDEEFEDIVMELYKARSGSKAKVVILFVGQDDAAGILKAATNRQLYNDFIWLASDGWGNGDKPVTGNERAAEGAITVTLKSDPIKEFDSYFMDLNPKNNPDNVWFHEYWEKAHNCTFTSMTTKKKCQGNEINKNYKQEAKIQFVFEAVYAVALSLDKLYREVCGNNSKILCAGMDFDTTMRAKLKDYITTNNQAGELCLFISFHSLDL